jgi:hypothetical protein
MLVFTPAQMEQFGTGALQSFHQRVAAHLREFFPNLVRDADDARIERLVRRAMQRAAAYDIQGELDIVRFIDLCLVLGVNFDFSEAHGWAEQLLRSPGLPAAARLRLVLDRAEQQGLLGR